MKRVLGVICVLVGAGVLAVFATGASNGKAQPSYWVELDDAFGLVSGGDFKVAGVRAGTIGEMKIDMKTHRALVQVKITKNGFGSIRTDATCQARPESLIGEYFLDCQPGTSPVELRPGSTIPVSHTSSVVAPDLVNDVLRLPYRERFSIIINELGAAVAGNAQNLNDAIRRASPGLQQTDRVLAILGRQNHVLADLVKNADTVIGDLAANRAQVQRWVVMADRTSAASAQRKAAIAEGFRLLPGFLEQLRPAMAQLGNVADQQTPALRTLTAAAPQLKTLFDRLAPFAKVSQPAFEALGKAASTGRDAVRAATPTVRVLNSFAKGVPELGKNLDIILKHLDNPAYGAEPDPNAPNPQGYTGLQSLIEYVYDQVLSINIYDSSVHILKVSPFAGDCAHYADINHALTNGTLGKLTDVCGAVLGPHSAGLNFPDTTRPDGMAPFGTFPESQQTFPPPSAASRSHRSARAATTLKPEKATPQTNPNVPTLSDVIPGAPSLIIPSPPKSVQDATQQATQAAQSTQSQATGARLLNYLLGG